MLFHGEDLATSKARGKKARISPFTLYVRSILPLAYEGWPGQCGDQPRLIAETIFDAADDIRITEGEKGYFFRCKLQETPQRATMLRTNEPLSLPTHFCADAPRSSPIRWSSMHQMAASHGSR